MSDDLDVMDLSLHTATERDIQTRFCMAGSDLITEADIEYLLFVAGNRQFLSDRIEALETKNKEQKRTADQLLIAANIWQDRTEALEKAAKDLLEATGHYTWNKLFKAPSVETAIQNMKKALKDE